MRDSSRVSWQCDTRNPDVETSNYKSFMPKQPRCNQFRSWYIAGIRLRLGLDVDGVRMSQCLDTLSYRIFIPPVSQ